jgi:SAM-dependent methyltransferase
LLSLQSFAEVVGIDVEPFYLQFTGVLARLEGVPVPTRVCGQAERLPFEDESFDVALFHGSLPYMRIEQALREAGRVLRPGGRALLIHGDLRQAIASRAGRLGWRLLAPVVILREMRAIAGMVAYPWLDRLFLEPFAPVYPTRSRMRRWLTQAGLRVSARETCRIAHEVCYVAEKPAKLE